MSTTQRPSQLWPELFEDLTEDQTRSIEDPLLSDLLEGQVFTREDVIMLRPIVTGEKSADEVIADLEPGARD